MSTVTKLDYKLLGIFKKLRSLSVDMMHDTCSYNGSIDLVEANCLFLINCIANIVTLRELMLKDLQVSKVISQALNKLLFVKNIQLCGMMFIESVNSYKEDAIWAAKLHTLSFHICDLSKLFIFVQNVRLPSLKEIIIADGPHATNINWSSFGSSVDTWKIKKVTLNGCHSPRVVTLIGTLRGLKTLVIVNSSGRLMTTLLKSPAIKLKIRRLTIIGSDLSREALKTISAFTQLHYLVLNGIDVVPNFDHKIFSSFKRKITLCIIDSKLTAVDFYAIQGYKKIKNIRCYGSESKWVVD